MSALVPGPAGCDDLQDGRLPEDPQPGLELGVVQVRCRRSGTSGSSTFLLKSLKLKAEALNGERDSSREVRLSHLG